MRGLVIGFGLSALLLAPTASATVPADLCTGNPCIVDHNVHIESGTLDFGSGTELRVAAGKTITLGPRESYGITADIIAGSIILEPGAKIYGRCFVDSSFTIHYRHIKLTAQTVNIEMQFSPGRVSRLDVSGGDSCEITLDAAGDVLIDGILTTQASFNYAWGGQIFISAGGNVNLSNRVYADGRGGIATSGGIVNVIADGDITLNRILARGGGSGGSVNVISTFGDVTADDRIDVSGRRPEKWVGSAGGNIDLTATAGNVTLNSELRSRGKSANPGGGWGGAAIVAAGGSVLMVDRAKIDLRAGRDGTSGYLSINAGDDFVQDARARIRNDGKRSGEYSRGGSVDIYVGGDATLSRIELGGYLAGNIFVNANGALTITDDIELGGAKPGGTSGSLYAQSCEISVESYALIDTKGRDAAGGSNMFRASGAMTIDGIVLASDSNTLQYKTVVPVINGVVDPAPAISQNLGLPDCPP